jgi:polyhydroxyalkanoate synthesis regulator phasin
MKLLPPSLRRIAIAGAAVLVLGGAAVGIAAAQAQPTPSGQAQTGYQKFIDALAKRLNIPTQTLETAVTQAKQDAGLPADGRGFPGAFGRGPRGGFGLNLNTAATAIGITPQQLKQELPGKSLAQVAQAHNKTGADVATALKNEAHTRIDQAVTNGRLTADQANTQKTQADQRIDQFVNQVMPQGGPGGRGPGGFGFGFGGRGFGFIGAGLDAAANAIGITPQQLRQELPGKSLAQVAEAHNKTGADVATALKNEAHTRIDQAVTNGRLTADQANTQKTQLDQRIDQLVNQVLPQRGPNPNPGQSGADEEDSTV